MVRDEDDDGADGRHVKSKKSLSACGSAYTCNPLYLLRVKFVVRAVDKFYVCIYCIVLSHAPMFF